jgi:hypothetical protein
MSTENKSLLNASQRALLTDYLSKPRTPQFTRVAELLFDEGMLDDCIFVLRQGLLDFPVLSSARLLLAKCCYLRGLFAEAETEITALENTQAKNISLLKVKLRIAVYHDRKDSAQVILRLLSEMIPEDNVMKKARLGLALGEFSNVKQILADESSFLSQKIKSNDLATTVLEGSYDKTLLTIKELLEQQNNSNQTSLNSKFDNSTMPTRANFDAFVQVPASSAARLQGDAPNDPRLTFLNTLLKGLDSLS